MAVRKIEWFKTEVLPILVEYDVTFRYFEDGDFGSLSQFDFNSIELGGNVDFWGLNWLGIYLWSYKEERVLLNVLLDPDQELSKEQAFKDLLVLLNS
jgi:hypothetical protein